MRYREAASGRLYAVDWNLQNCPREVRFAALDGCWDYDVSNCHFALLAQLSEEGGFRCPAIRHYLTNKNTIRHALAIDVGVSVESIKKCLLVLIYDAHLSRSERSAIGNELGRENAARLLRSGPFNELAAEVKQAGRRLVERWPTVNGRLLNHGQYGISTAAAHPKKLAHILHGAEALILKEAVAFVEQQRPGNVLLLQHDGFSVRGQLDLDALNAHVHHVTGFDVLFEGEQIRTSTIPNR